jgi:hypothetical protein
MKFMSSILLTGVLVGTAACTNTPPEVPAPMNANGQVSFAKTDLAKRLGVAVESVVVSSTRPVTWRSGALGCPDPGMIYTQALVPGTVIYLQADNSIYAYHARYGGEPFYCPRDRVEAPASEGDDLT